MGTQVLRGSKGFYKSSKVNPVCTDNSEFIVINDVCLEADKLTVLFKHATEPCRIPMKKAIFASDAKYKDY